MNQIATVEHQAVQTVNERLSNIPTEQFCVQILTSPRPSDETEQRLHLVFRKAVDEDPVLVISGYRTIEDYSFDRDDGLIAELERRGVASITMQKSTVRQIVRGLEL